MACRTDAMSSTLMTRPSPPHQCHHLEPFLHRLVEFHPSLLLLWTARVDGLVEEPVALNRLFEATQLSDRSTTSDGHAASSAVSACSQTSKKRGPPSTVHPGSSWPNGSSSANCEAMSASGMKCSRRSARRAAIVF